jgi:hypothetical protein
LLALLIGPVVSTAYAAVPFPMASGNYSESFGDIANWTNNFAAGIGAQYWASVPIHSSGTIPDGVRITVSTAAFVSGTQGGVQKGSGNIQLLSTNGTDLTNADAIDLLLDFTGVTAGDSANTTDVGRSETPSRPILRAAMPNPFQNRTALAYDLPHQARVSLRIYDVTGRLVRSLVSGAVQEAGHHSVEWDGCDDSGAAAPAGMYFVGLGAGRQSPVRRLVRVR